MKKFGFHIKIKNVLPSPFTIAVLLSILTIVLAYFFSSNTNNNSPKFLQIISFWEMGFWELLSFSMQMVLILLLGHVLALSKPINKLIAGITQYCNNTANSAAIVAFSCMLMGFFNWGLGLVFGAILARKVAERAKENNIAINYPIIGAAGYAGMMIWHGGLSGSAPLVVSENTHFLMDKIGVVDPSLTILSGMNISASLLFLGLVPLLLFVLGKRSKGSVPTMKFKTLEDPSSNKETEKLDHSRILGISFGAIIIMAAVYKASQSTGGSAFSFLQLNFINLFLFGLAIVCHGNFKSFSNAVEDAVSGCSGIIIQFPLYAGIMGIMKYSGLVGEISEFFVQISTQTTLPIFTFFSAAIVNVFVPSGGGQWAVQGPIIVEAAQGIGASIPKNIMALAYGDQITNMIQPFWALPLLGITQLKAKDLLPITFLMMLLGIAISLLILLIF